MSPREGGDRRPQTERQDDGGPRLRGDSAGVADALRDAARRLAPVSDSARLDAELLMAEALGVSRSELLLRHLQDDIPVRFPALVDRRERHEPIAYILGRKEFYGLEFLVTPAVLIPRQDSETVIDAAREALARTPPARILDLGTGSGALLLAALSLWPHAAGRGVDNSLPALIVAVRNAQRLANPAIAVIGDGDIELPQAKTGRGFAQMIQRDWTEPGWADDLGQYDLILCNPPYVEDSADLGRSVKDFEPAQALFAGAQGLDAYEVLIPQLLALLAPKGIAVLEIGATQAEVVENIAAACGFACELRHDLGGRPRALILRLRLGK